MKFINITRKLTISLFMGIFIGLGIFISNAVDITTIFQDINPGDRVKEGWFDDIRNKLVNIYSTGSGGNLGIGVSNPSQKLEVGGNIKGSNIEGVDIKGTRLCLGANCISNWTSTTQWLSSGSTISYTGGNVGIGTRNPTNPLSVVGIIQSTSGGFRFPDGTTQTTGRNTSLGTKWLSSGSTIAYTGGYVGIGTRNPTNPLSVSGVIQSTSGGFRFPDGTTQTTGWNTGLASQWLSSGSTIAYTGGYVGIGTRNPSSSLSISGSLQLGSDNDTCNITKIGVVHYKTDTKTLELCDGLAWATLKTLSPIYTLPLETEVTFTTCGQSGRLGPSQTQCNNAYSGTNLAGNVTLSGGIQYWTVPETGTYTIETMGAAGADGTQDNNMTTSLRAGGKGAYIKADYDLQAGQVLQILVGQKGSRETVYTYQPGGGGGGTFVVIGNTPLVVAGGGGGGGANGTYPQTVGDHGTISEDGSITVGPLSGNAGKNGNGGGATSYNGGGAGFVTNGGIINNVVAAESFLNGGEGGYSTGHATNSHGGFGGGGGAQLLGGGGGGYSGGGTYGTWTTNGTAGGGGSYNRVGYRSTQIAGYNTGHGQVKISKATIQGNQKNGDITSTVTFGTCGQTGRFGPNQTQCNGVYGNSELDGFVTVSAGIQEWTVPTTGTYTIETMGAAGADGTQDNNMAGYLRTGGKGAYMKADFDLQAGQVLKVMVGQKGSRETTYIHQPGGGGGGTFVAIGNNPIIVAGGGGGGGDGMYGGTVGGGSTSSESGNVPVGPLNSNAGSNGMGGGYSDGTPYFANGGGAGFVGNGLVYGTYGPAKSFLNGGEGGYITNRAVSSHGGFGGGGGAGLLPGGGGGYSGGGTYGAWSTSGAAGGGGSYNRLGYRAVHIASYNSGDGQVRISKATIQGNPNNGNISAPVTFNTCGQSGRFGPTQSQCNGTYSNSELDGFVRVEGGIQLWTVPETGVYTIEAVGAAGAEGTQENNIGGYLRMGGSGAYAKASFDLIQGDVLKILVGQKGSREIIYLHQPGGGGGGTFVVKDYTPLVVAGGGGGGGDGMYGQTIGNSASSSESGTLPNGGTLGQGGGSTGHNGGGAGFYGNGLIVAGYNAVEAKSFMNGGDGGYFTGWAVSSHGGFGGGGGGGLLPGGGGGYSGGGTSGAWSTTGTAGGGGSYISPLAKLFSSSQTASYNNGHGYVIITKN